MGSKKPHLHALALKVFSLSIHNDIKLEPEWIPRSLNERADLLSRIVDYDDWMLNPVVFAEVDRLWGPHSVDRFANWQNCQTTRFNSRCWSPGSEAVDAFTVDWGKENMHERHKECKNAQIERDVTSGVSFGLQQCIAENGIVST